MKQTKTKLLQHSDYVQKEYWSNKQTNWYWILKIDLLVCKGYKTFWHMTWCCVKCYARGISHVTIIFLLTSTKTKNNATVLLLLLKGLTSDSFKLTASQGPKLLHGLYFPAEIDPYQKVVSSWATYWTWKPSWFWKPYFSSLLRKLWRTKNVERKRATHLKINLSYLWFFEKSNTSVGLTFFSKVYGL